jgi:hypothetical protein
MPEHEERLLYIIPIPIVITAIIGLIFIVISLIVKKSNEKYKVDTKVRTKIGTKAKRAPKKVSNTVINKVDAKVDAKVKDSVSDTLFFTKTNNNSNNTSQIELLGSVTAQTLQLMTSNNILMLPNAVKSVISVIGEKKFRDFATGTPYIVDITSYLPKNAADVPSSYYIKIVRDIKVPDGRYMSIKSDKVESMTSHDGIDFVDNIKFEISKINVFLKMLKMLAEYFYLGKQDSVQVIGQSTGFIEVATAGLGNLVFPPSGLPDVPIIDIPPPNLVPPIQENERLIRCSPWGNRRNQYTYDGEWDKVIIVNDSEVEALGDDVYGILSIGNMSTGGFTSNYVIAGQDDRSKLVNIRQSDNLGFGRSDLADVSYTTRNCLPKYSREYGQGTKVGIVSGKIVTVYPFICGGNKTKLDVRFNLTLSQPLANFRIIVKDATGNILSTDGTINGICNWITYDKCSNLLITPNDYECSYLNLYDVKLSAKSLILTLIKTATFTEPRSASPDTYNITAACICEDGNLYAIVDDGLLLNQGVIIFEPRTRTLQQGRVDWEFVQVGSIIMQVDDTLVGITEVDDIRIVKTSNVPTLVVIEINEDYFTQDNVTLHELIPTGAIVRRRGPFGTPTDTGSLRDIADTFSCGGGVVIYNSQRALNNLFITRDTPITLNDPALRGYKNYLISRNIHLDIDLDRVVIYDNQCLSANYFKYSEGERHTVNGMCFGYTIYLRDRLVQNDGTIRGRILKVIMHELAHTRQFVQLGESFYQFGCVYGESVLYPMLEHGGDTYTFNPMEVEARNFADRHWIRDARIARRWGINIDTSATSFEYDRSAFPTTCGAQP